MADGEHTLLSLRFWGPSVRVPYHGFLAFSLSTVNHHNTNTTNIRVNCMHVCMYSPRWSHHQRQAHEVHEKKPYLGQFFLCEVGGDTQDFVVVFACTWQKNKITAVNVIKKKRRLSALCAMWQAARNASDVTATYGWRVWCVRSRSAPYGRCRQCSVNKVNRALTERCDSSNNNNHKQQRLLLLLRSSALVLASLQPQVTSEG